MAESKKSKTEKLKEEEKVTGEELTTAAKSRNKSNSSSFRR